MMLQTIEIIAEELQNEGAIHFDRIDDDDDDDDDGDAEMDPKEGS